MMSNVNKDVVLVNPKDGVIPYDYYATYENLGIAYLASSLRASNKTVAIVDAYARNLDYRDAAQEILSYSPEVVGFTSTYLSYPEALKIAELIKEALPNVHITLGGEHASYGADDIFKETNLIDSIIFGEGETTIVDLVETVKNGGDLESVQGIGYSNNNQLHINPYRPPIKELDAIPFPARDTLDFCVNNQKPGLIGMLASRGCAFNCSFCNANRFFNFGGKPLWRKRSPKNIVDELEYIYKSYYDKGLYKLIYFYDATFIYPTSAGRQWVKEICEEIIRRDIHIAFEINCRADSLTDANDELLPLLKRAGLKSVFIGLESGSEEVLNKYNKKVSVEQNVRIMNILREHGIQSTTNGFIMFNPYISLQGLKESADFLLRIGHCTYWNLSQKVQLFPGIQLIKDLKEEGLLLNTYKHNEVYAYKFKDSDVAILAEALNFSQEEAPTRENHLIRYVEILGSQLMDLVNNSEALNAEQYNHVMVLNNKISEARQEVFKLNHNFFFSAIELIEKQWNQKEFFDLKNSYLDTLESKLNLLNDSFKDFIEYLNSQIT